MCEYLTKNFSYEKIKKKIYADDPEPIMNPETQTSYYKSASNVSDINPSSFIFSDEKANKYEVKIFFKSNKYYYFFLSIAIHCDKN